MDKGHRITFFGQAWLNASVDCIYYHSRLDLDELKSKFNLKDTVVVHENLDPKSGTERGFIDNATGEGLMGRLH